MFPARQRRTSFTDRVKATHRFAPGSLQTPIAKMLASTGTGTSGGYSYLVLRECPVPLRVPQGRVRVPRKRKINPEPRRSFLSLCRKRARRGRPL